MTGADPIDPGATGDRRSDPSVRWLGMLPELERPVLVTMLTGWIDAGSAGRAAAGVIEDDILAHPIAEFDDDVYVDYRARRPIMELRDGLNSVLNWERIVLSHGRERTKHDVLLLSGPEPDMAWHRFARAVGDVASALGVRYMVHLGAYPFATPHTRPVRISVSSPSQDVLTKVPYLRSSVDVPAGIAAALEHELHERGIPTLGIWAQVPHYISTMSYPAASVALIDALHQVTGLRIDTSALRGEAMIQARRFDSLVAANDEHQTMVGQLERVYDAEAADGAAPDGDRLDESAGPSPTLEIRSADELAAEVEEFLRGQD